MWHIIEKLRQKPEEYRRRIVLFATGLITGLIVVIWLSLLYGKYLESSQQKKELRNTATPFEVFSQDVKQKIGDLMGNYNDLKSQINTVVQDISTSSQKTFPTGIATTTDASSLPEKGVNP